MVREQQYRRKKYKAKTDGAVSEIRFDATKTLAQTLHQAGQEILVPQEEYFKVHILEPAGIAVNELPFYLDAGREFCKCCRQFTSVTRHNKCLDIYYKWLDKGLNNNCLVLMATYCGCDLMAYYEYSS